MLKVKKLTPRVEAQSERTSPERLRKLAKDPKLAKLVEELSYTSDKARLKAFVSNPNTPTD
jgi:hypothetical protein